MSSSPARNLDFFDLGTGAKVATIDDLIAEPHEIAVDEERRRAYVAHTYRQGFYGQDVARGHEISVIDVDGRRVESVIDIAPWFGPHDVEYDPGLDLIITGVEDVGGRKGVVLIDGSTHGITGCVETDAPNCHWLALVPGRKVYVTHKEAPFVTVIDLVGRRVEATIDLPGGAEEIDASPEGDAVFAVTPRMRLGTDGPAPPAPGDPVPRIVKIDVAADAIVDQVELDQPQMGLRAGHDGRLYSTGVGDPASDVPGVLHVIDATTMSAVGRVEVGPRPLTVRVTEDNALAWVADLVTGLVNVLDLVRLAPVGELVNSPAHGGTHGMALVPPVRP